MSQATKTLRCAVVYRLEDPGPKTVLLAKYDHAHKNGEDIESHTSDKDVIYGGKDTNFGEAVGALICKDQSSSISTEKGTIAGFKVVQSGQHQLVYGCDCDRIYYAVIVGRDYPSRVAITGLGEMHKEFSAKFGRGVTLAAKEGSLTKDASRHHTLKEFCQKYETPGGADATHKVLDQVAGVKSQMQSNIHNMLKNSEDAGKLKEKTTELNQQAGMFKKRTKKLKKNMWWKNMKTTVILVMVVAAVLLMILVPLTLRLIKLKNEMAFNTAQN